MRITQSTISIPVAFASLGLVLFAVMFKASAQEGFDGGSVQAFLNKSMVKVPKSEPTSTVDDMQLMALAYDIGQFREGSVLGLTVQATAALPQVVPGAMEKFQDGKITATFPYVWPYVVAGSFFVVGQSLGDDPVAAFYNPYFDVVILTQWRFFDKDETDSAPGFKLIQAIPVTGQAFIGNRESRRSDQPVWTNSDSLFEARLVTASRDFVAAFEKRFPPFGRESVTLAGSDSASQVAVEVIELRAFSLMKWVIDAQNASAPVNYADEVKDLAGALSSSFPGRLAKLLPTGNPQGAEIFFRLDQEIREGMRPYLVVGRKVILLDPLNLATGFISVHYQAKGSGFEPGVVTLFNLDADYPDK